MDALRQMLIPITATLMFSGCSSMTTPLAGTEVDSIIAGEHRISVGTMSRGGWYANTAGQMSYAPETRLLLIEAIEDVSGCQVIPETLTGANHAVFAAVDCQHP